MAPCFFHVDMPTFQLQVLRICRVIWQMYASASLGSMLLCYREKKINAQTFTFSLIGKKDLEKQTGKH